MSLCLDCIKGVTHEGIPKGQWERIRGVNTYVATPSNTYSKNTAILFLTDAFGPQLINSQLLADDFAENGFKVFIPDYFAGDAVPADALGPARSFDVTKWLSKHGERQTRPPLDEVIQELKENRGITIFGATGYCFGGRYVFDLAFENIIQASVVSHPSLIRAPDDFKTYLAKSKAPLLINSCPIDSQFPVSSSNQADEILGNGKFAPGYKRIHFEGCKHGFTIRGDMSDPNVKAGKESAFKATVQWFRTHLQENNGRTKIQSML